MDSYLSLDNLLEQCCIESDVKCLKFIQFSPIATAIVTSAYIPFAQISRGKSSPGNLLYTADSPAVFHNACTSENLQFSKYPSLKVIVGAQYCVFHQLTV